MKKINIAPVYWAEDACGISYNKYQVNPVEYLQCLKDYDFPMTTKKYCDIVFWEGYLYKDPFI